MAESASLLRTLTGAGAGIASPVRRLAGGLVPRFREGNLEVLISQLALSAYFGVERPHYSAAQRKMA